MAHMVVIKSMLMNFDIIMCHPKSVQQFPQVFVGLEVFVGFVRFEWEFPAVISLSQGNVNDGPILVRPEGQNISVRPPTFHAGINNHPPCFGRVANQFDTKFFPRRVIPAMTPQQITRSHGSGGTGIHIPNCQCNAIFILRDADDILAKLHIYAV